jgi:hypothetical protein
MLGNILSPITAAMEALSGAIIWGLIIFGVIQMASIITIAVRAYYSLKIIKQVSILLREIIQEVGELKREWRRTLK